MADGGQVELFVVVSACGEHRAIVQSRCLGLTGTDIHIHIHTYKQGLLHNAITCLAFRLGNKAMQYFSQTHPQNGSDTFNDAVPILSKIITTIFCSGFCCNVQ